MLVSLFDSVAFFEAVALRCACGAGTALLVSLLFGRWFVRYQIRNRRLERVAKGDSDRLDTLHNGKSDTPTMGGLIFLVGMACATLLWARLDNRFTWILLLVTASLGLIGFLDDFVKLRGIRRKGLPARAKLVCQLLIGGALGLYLWFSPLLPDAELATALVVPFAKWTLPLGVAFVAFVALVIAGSSNAVNLTDGLDGLAIGCSILAAVPLTAAALIAGDAGLSGRLEQLWVPGCSEVAVFASSMLGASLGFLRFNRHPARIFMGDTGALALGGALGSMAILTKKEVLFVLIGGVFVVEVLSVVLQVASFKLTGKRIFLIAPLHHHFQFKGWKETRVTRRFWLAAAILACLSLGTVRFW